MPKDFKTTEELKAAVDKMLDQGITAKTAKEFFSLALYDRAVDLEGGNEAAAAKRLGVARQQLHEARSLLRVRLA